jgi:rhodanese-related sulfurtransferase
MRAFLYAIFAAILAVVPASAAVSPMTVPGAVTVDVDQAAALFEKGAVFVDVRKPSDYEAGRIPDAVHLDLIAAYSEESLAAAVGKDEPVVIYCNGESCARSSEACVRAVGWGFTQVHYFRDGYPAWEAAGLPVE